MPVSRNRKKHKTQLAKRQKAAKLKKELFTKAMNKYIAQIEEAQKNKLQNPIGPVENPNTDPTVSDAEVLEILADEHTENNESESK